VYNLETVVASDRSLKHAAVSGVGHEVSVAWKASSLGRVKNATSEQLNIIVAKIAMYTTRNDETLIFHENEWNTVSISVAMKAVSSSRVKAIGAVISLV